MAVLLDRAMPFTSVAFRGGAQRRNATVTLAVDPLVTSTIRIKWAAHVLRNFRLNTKRGETSLSMAASSGFTTQSSVVCSRAVATAHCKNPRQQLLRIDRRLLTDSVEAGTRVRFRWYLSCSQTFDKLNPLSRQLNYRIIRRDRRVIPSVIKRSVIAEWTVPLRIAIGLQHQIPNLYPGKIVFSEAVGY